MSHFASVRQLGMLAAAPYRASAGRVKPNLAAWDLYWKCDEGTGTAVANSGSKSGLGATLVNASGGLPLWETDADLGGACLNFNSGATVNRIRSDTAYPANFRPSSTMSVLYAVKLRSLGGAGLYPGLLQYGDYVSGTDRNGWYNYLSYNNDGNLRGSTCNGGSGQADHAVTHATAGLSTGIAVLIGWTKNGTTSKWFVNGTQVGSSGSAQSAIGYRANEYIVFGHSSDPSVSTDASFGLEGTCGWIAATATDESANMLAIAQAAGFA